MFLKLKKNEEDWSHCCLNCEFAKLNEADEYPETVFCEKQKKEKPTDACCRHYAYDLLKRKPMRHTEIPTLDPDLLQ